MALDSDTRGGSPRARRGFTLVELSIVIALIGLLAGLTGTSYMRFVEKARVTRAVAELSGIAAILDGLSLDGSALPDTLSAADIRVPDDPWGNPYEYLKIEGGLPPGISGLNLDLPHVAAPPEGGGGGPPVVAMARKDGFLVPINSDYDLYSMGKDGKTKVSLNNPVSRDDVIRAGDGSYYGIAEEY